MLILWLFRAMILSALLSLALTPMDFRIANALGAIDVPRDGRRMHKRPIPRLGGLSIFFSFLLLSVFYDFKIASDLFYIWSGAILIVLIGVLDDELALPPLLKFAVQCAAAYVSTMGGGLLRTLTFGEKSLSLGIFSLPITLLFTVTLTNAHNFIDGLDGLCAGVSLSECLALVSVVLPPLNWPWQASFWEALALVFCPTTGTVHAYLWEIPALLFSALLSPHSPYERCLIRLPFSFFSPSRSPTFSSPSYGGWQPEKTLSFPTVRTSTTFSPIASAHTAPQNSSSSPPPSPPRSHS